MRKTRSFLANAITRADTGIATWQRRQLAANTTSVRVRWQILRSYVTLWDRGSRPGATNISTSRPKNFAISRPPAKILCAHSGRKSTVRFSNVWFVYVCGKQRTIVLLCAEHSGALLVTRNGANVTQRRNYLRRRSQTAATIPLWSRDSAAILPLM